MAPHGAAPEEDDMAELSAIQLETSSTVSTRTVDHVLKLFTGALFTASLVAAGAVLVLVALTLGVIGAPVIALALGVWAVRRREAPARFRTT
jgi:hypothetical protein